MYKIVNLAVCTTVKRAPQHSYSSETTKYSLQKMAKNLSFLNL